MRQALIVLGTLLAANGVGAQSIQVCETDWLSHEELDALLRVELREDDPGIRSVVVHECNDDGARLSVFFPDWSVETRRLELSGVDPTARARTLALMAAELVQLGAARVTLEVPETAAETDAEPMEPAQTLGEPSAGHRVADERLSFGLAVDTPGARAVDQETASGTPGPEPYAAEIGADGGVRLFANPGTAAPMGRIRGVFGALVLDAHMARAVSSTPFGDGEVEITAFALGAGARVAQLVMGPGRVSLDLRGEAGAITASGTPFDFERLGHSESELSLAAIAGGHGAIWMGDFELRIDAEIGWMTGLVATSDGLPIAGMDGLLVSLTMGAGFGV